MFVLADEEGSILSPRNSSYLLNAYHVGGVVVTGAVCLHLFDMVSPFPTSAPNMPWGPARDRFLRRFPLFLAPALIFIPPCVDDYLNFLFHFSPPTLPLIIFMFSQ